MPVILGGTFGCLRISLGIDEGGRENAAMRSLLVALSLIVCASVAFAADDGPIRLCKENPHYLFFKGKPTVLISSAEHYGAVLNLDFNCVPYLDTLKKDGLNQSRCFSGYYREVQTSFGIRDNTLAPKPDHYSSPWAKTADGKYDLEKWNDDHFKRMRDYVAEAAKRDVVIELVLFCPFYKDELWDICPLNAKNNSNGVGKDVKDRKEVNTLKHKDIVAVQKKLARKIVQELNGFDNVYYEICNEPYFGGDLLWQQVIALAIVNAEANLPKKHLIAQNIANGSRKVEQPDENVSILNFHYCNPPQAVEMNADLHRAIAYDETGFKGSGDDVYRIHAWQFMLAGGAIFSHLDYSFTAKTPEGTSPISAPGGGGVEIRKQLAILKQQLESMDIEKLKPATDIAAATKGITVTALTTDQSNYLVYIARAVEEKKKNAAGKEVGTGVWLDPDAGKPVTIQIRLPAENLTEEWINTRTGNSSLAQVTRSPAGMIELTSPAFKIDIALRIRPAK
jgi:hypothetical protein